MKGRQRFQCVKCFLLIEGKVDKAGMIRPYDRAGHDGSPAQPCMCIGCASSGVLGVVVADDVVERLMRLAAEMEKRS